jgi:hypothetical protein
VTRTTTATTQKRGENRRPRGLINLDTLFDEMLTAETRTRYDAGMNVEEAAGDLILDEFKSWLDHVSSKSLQNRSAAAGSS